MTQPHDPHHDPRYQGPQPPPQQPGPPPGYGPPQGAPPPGYGPQAPQPGYGPPPQQPGYGPQQPGYGPPPGGYPPPQKKSSAGLIIGIVAGALVLVLLIGGAGVWFFAQGAEPDGPGGTAYGDAEVLTFEDLDASHVEVGETVEYDVFPPAGGPHYPSWQDCGVYSEPLVDEFAVHSLEHGAVWITYDPSLSPDEVAELEGLYAPGDYLVISPMDGLPSRVVASAWGSQIRLDDPADPALAEYLRTYVQGPDTPEPGAPCSGGVSESGDAAEALVTGSATTA
ncbi:MULTISPECIES: DUF3105 domain-containing protein [unclassified Nocardiopsis]|uniref:DUF3105 domain-containing protein n=1 Tax=Nocardiopsis TaxID=2013 RepID=UPI00387B9C7B